MQVNFKKQEKKNSNEMIHYLKKERGRESWEKKNPNLKCYSVA